MAFRDFCPALLNKTYFNYGGQGPLPTPSLEAIQTSWRRIQELGPFTTDVWPFIGAEVSSTRRRLAQLCGVAPHRLALSENVTTGCVLPLWGLPFEAGDRLLISDCEHPGVVAACVELARRENLEIDTLPVQQLRGDQSATDAGVTDALEQSLTPSTRLVVLSHLLWNTGQIMPIAAVAEQLAQHPRAPYLLVDAAQSFGQIPVQEAAAAADIYAFTGHKWACGPEGLGGVALSERVLAEGQPTVIGWRSLSDETSAGSPWHRDGRRFEIATSCVPLGAGLRRSLDLLDEAGNAAQREARIQALSRRLWHGLQQIKGMETLLQEAPPPSGLVSFTAQKHRPEAVVHALADQGFQLRSLDDPHCVRACTHICTTEAEIDALLGVLANFSATA